MQKIATKSPPHLSQVNGDCYTGSSPGSGSLRFQTFPEQFVPVASLGVAPHYSGGTAPALHRLFYYVLADTCTDILFFLYLLSMLLTLLYRKHLLLSRVFILTISTFSAKILNHCRYHRTANQRAFHEFKAKSALSVAIIDIYHKKEHTTYRCVSFILLITTAPLHLPQTSDSKETIHLPFPKEFHLRFPWRTSAGAL
jgi:hypothetical protein